MRPLVVDVVLPKRRWVAAAPQAEGARGTPLDDDRRLLRRLAGLVADHDRHQGCLHRPGLPGTTERAVEDPALDKATKTLREREPPSTQCLIARVMTKIIHDQVWPGSTLPFGGPTRALRTAERAASAVLRRAADEVPGVTTVSCRLA